MRDLKIENGGTKDVALSEEDRELTADELAAVAGGQDASDQGQWCRAVMKFSETDQWVISSNGQKYRVTHQHNWQE